ncbi:unnamed protein product [Amoebophrya sp. A25]|nr:unnamed protein product [Amoebophrya sp. A25]|eukprot:GSA25T00011176001.1
MVVNVAAIPGDDRDADGRSDVSDASSTTAGSETNVASTANNKSKAQAGGSSSSSGSASPVEKKRRTSTVSTSASSTASSTSSSRPGAIKANVSAAAEKQKVTCLSDIELTDETAQRSEYHFGYFGLLDKFILPLLRDKRDLPMVYLQLNIINFLWPLALAVLYTGNVYLGIAYLPIALLGFMERFILMLHFASHRKVFKNEFLSGFALYFIAPFFGIPPGAYYLHHIIMHHGENNHGLDTSETESYHREGVFGFLKYWLRFLVGLSIELPVYALRTGRVGWFFFFWVCMGSWASVIAACWKFFTPTGTIFVWIAPHFLALSAMALGNYAQHVFVDPDSPSNNYTLSYNCLNVGTNQTTFNDGYHILHHIFPRLHWSELPRKFATSLREHKSNRALTFRNIHFFDVGVLVLTGQIEKLAREHYVFLDEKGIRREQDKSGVDSKDKRSLEEEVPTVADVTRDLYRRLTFIPPYSRKID